MHLTVDAAPQGDFQSAERMLLKAKRLYEGVEGWNQLRCTLSVQAALRGASGGVKPLNPTGNPAFVDW